jgi:hypothetical protein
MSASPTTREIVEFGLEAIAPDRTVTVSLRDLLFVHQTVEELNRFFHQPLHYPDVKALRSFLGSRGSGGAYEVLAECYYNKLRAMVPSDVQALIEEGTLEHPEPPAYFKASN